MKRKSLDAFRVVVANRANYCCEYCRFLEQYSLASFHLDHIVSVKHGGMSILNNLAYTRSICNWNKGSDIATITAEGVPVRLYHPRHQIWAEHFKLKWAKVSPLVEVGEATIKILRINDADRVPERQMLQVIGAYPRV